MIINKINELLISDSNNVMKIRTERHGVVLP